MNYILYLFLICCFLGIVYMMPCLLSKWEERGFILLVMLALLIALVVKLNMLRDS